MNKRRLFLIGLILLCAGTLFARGKKEKEENPPVQIVKITGVVRLVGNDNFSELVISNTEGEWYIANEEKDKLHQLQQQTVTVEGEESVFEMRFAGGMSAGTRRTLRNIRIISTP
jgi:hypothetical protein